MKIEFLEFPAISHLNDDAIEQLVSKKRNEKLQTYCVANALYTISGEWPQSESFPPQPFNTLHVDLLPFRSFVGPPRWRLSWLRFGGGATVR